MSDDPQPIFERALAHHRAGRLAEAEADYRALLARFPGHPDCLHLCGVIASQRGEHAQAVELITQAIAAQPAVAVFFNNRGNSQFEQGRAAEALQDFDQALALQADYVDALNNRGNALQRLGRREAALAAYEQALAQQPDYAKAHNNRGNLLQELGRLDEARAAYERAIALQPDFAQAHANLGNALHELGQSAAALPHYERALALDPGYARGWCNRGIALHALQRFAEALACYDRALALRLDSAEMHFNRGLALGASNRVEQAADSYQAAIARDPDHIGANWNKSLTCLLAGDFRQGWALYEWRWKSEGAIAYRRDFVQPQWYGDEDLAGRTILLHAEQGLGDTLQFCRYVPLVAARGARVILEVPPPLRRLLADLPGVDTLRARGEPLPDFELHCPLMSLPLAFATELATIPQAIPYLRSDPARVAAWRETLGPATRPRIGLAWQGNPEHVNDRQRSLPLARLLPCLPDAYDYYCLQKEIGDEDRALLAADGRIVDLSAQLLDFTDTAALCEVLDLVVCVDTSVAHLAAALGRPTWLLLAHVPDWRWLTGRDDSPWYPDVRLYRQPAVGDWESAVQRLLADLQQLPWRLTPEAAAGKLDQAVRWHQQGQLDRAAAQYREILAHFPQQADCLHLLGVIAAQQGDHRQAVESICRAIAVNDRAAAFFNNLGNSQQALGDLRAALASFDRALALRPDYVEAHNNRGNALQKLGDSAAALAAHEQALACDSAYARAWCNRGNVLFENGELDAARASYERALAIAPGLGDAEWPLAMLDLLHGNFATGWARYEARWRTSSLGQQLRWQERPRWQGEALAGKTLLLHAEQGLGDTLQFCRYALLAAGRGGRAMLEVQPGLGRLLRTLAPEIAVFERGETLPPFDWQCPLLSLPGLLAPTPDTWPAPPAYLACDPARRQDWQRKLGPRRRPRVGLAWRGNPDHANDRRRSLPLASLLAWLPAGCDYFSLLPALSDAEAAALATSGIRHFAGELGDFAETAALCSLMDCVISVDTSVAHLAGALGRPTWLLLSFVPDWRWLLGRAETPWYPQMRLLRQAALDDWAAVGAQVGAGLRRLIDDDAALAALVPQGLALQQQGQFAAAADCYRRVLERNPLHGDARYLLGVIALQTGQPAEAERLIGEALEIHPEHAAYLGHRALALQAMGRLDEAFASYRQAWALAPGRLEILGNFVLALREFGRRDEALAVLEQALTQHPGQADLHFQQALCLQEGGKSAAALAAYERALACNPRLGGAHLNRGVLLLAAGQADAALASFEQAVACLPGVADAWNNRGNALLAKGELARAVADYRQAVALMPAAPGLHLNLAMALGRQGDLAAALAACQQALMLAPNAAEAHFCHANLRREQGGHAAALAAYDAALACAPGHVGAWCNRGSVLLQQGCLDEAAASFAEALRHDPERSEAQLNLANVDKARGDYAAAITGYEAVIARQPQHVEAHWNLALVHLTLGDFARGWPLYEWRWRNPALGLVARHGQRPLWRGEPLAPGQTLLLHAEQGLGDTLQFCRFVTAAAAGGGRILLEAPRPLHGLLAGLPGLAGLHAPDEALPDFDWQCPLLSLPLALRTSLAAIPARDGYLEAPAAALSRWQAALGAASRPRVGLVWRGNPAHSNDHNRSLSLARLLPWLPAGCDYFVLQKELTPAEQSLLAATSDLRITRPALADFDDTAALSCLMDVVIAVDTSVAHLAGALGQSTWLLLPFVPDWRWLLGRTDSVWYDSVRLYRQAAPGDWESVLSAVQAALRTLAGED